MSCSRVLTLCRVVVYLFCVVQSCTYFVSCSRVLTLCRVLTFVTQVFIYLSDYIRCYHICSSEDEVLPLQALDLRDILLQSATRVIHIGKTYFCCGY